MIYFRLFVYDGPGRMRRIEQTDDPDRVALHLAEATGEPAAWRLWYGAAVFATVAPPSTVQAAVWLLDPALRVVETGAPRPLDEALEEVRRGIGRLGERANKAARRLQSFSLRVRHLPVTKRKDGEG